MTATGSRSKPPLTEQRIRAFEQRYGRQATALAAHAAFPLTLTTDLVYCLRETFLPDCPWYAAADLLLSGLCTTVGYDLYEMDIDVRRFLLSYLRDRFGASQVYEVERFMTAYLRHRIRVEDSDRPLILGEKPHWTSLACLRPGEAFAEIQRTLQQLVLGEANPKERFRLAALVESYDEFLDDFLAEQGFQHILLNWADRLAEGEPIDDTADLVKQLKLAGWDLQLVGFEVATLEEGQAAVEESTSEEELHVFEFETVRVNARGEVIQTERHQALFFSEPLAEGVPPLEMVAIPSGEFIMGSPDDEPERYSAESPPHRVTISPFFISKYPLTQAQWRAVASLPKVDRDLDPDPSHFKGDPLPVEQISWYDAIEFCQRLSQSTRREYRLPSEAEWEYACRADTTTPFYFGETITTELANYNGNYTYRSERMSEYREKTTEVGSFPPNAFGLCDMHGNVWEWCQDHWHSNYEGASTDGSAWLTEYKGAERVVRGGSWHINPRDCRSAYRNPYSIDNHNEPIGFRVVCHSWTKNQLIPIDRLTIDNLTTEKGINYTKLRDLLATGQCREADEETWKIMLQVTGQQERGYLYSSDVGSIPSADLRTIDRLWVKYSQGKFGFSVQKRIWYEVNQDWERFTERVGWREANGKFKNYDLFTFSTNAPAGHFPFQFGTPDYCWVWGRLGMGSEMSSLLSRQDL